VTSQPTLLPTGDSRAVGDAPAIACPRCGVPAPRVSWAVGMDLHECRACHALSGRWLCCGAVTLEPAAWPYRGRDVCEKCGVNRRPAPVEMPEHESEMKREET
jgi:hypothetical protein